MNVCVKKVSSKLQGTEEMTCSGQSSGSEEDSDSNDNPVVLLRFPVLTILPGRDLPVPDLC